ncbi:MAG TPA: mechanosensitive ion channel, partial [Deltaproteobacteria bacterium]|nr:mechanosensitive ion channel [Deltaproteobacteria bacterium]
MSFPVARFDPDEGHRSTEKPALRRPRTHGPRGRRVRTECHVLVLLILLAWNAASAPAYGQAIPSTPPSTADSTPAAGEPAGPVPIPIAEISAREEKLRAVIREADTRSAETAATEAIANSLADLAPNVLRRASESRLEEGKSPPIEVLDDLRREWSSIDQTIRVWADTLTRRADALGRQLDQLEALQQTWRLTKKAARESDAPQAVLDQIEKALDQIGPAIERTRTARDRVFTLQAELAKLSGEVSTQLEAIDRARIQLLGQLFRPDHVPLWSPRLWQEDLSIIPEALHETIGAKFDQAARYLRDHLGEIQLEILVLAILAGLLFTARHRAPEWESDLDAGQVEILECVLHRPFSAAILFGLPLAPWIHPQAPSLLIAIAGTLVLIPTLHVLLPLFGSALRPALLALAAFYLTDQIRHAAVGIPLLPRALFVLEMGVGTFVLGWIVRPGRLAALPPAAGREVRFRWIGRALRGMRNAFAVALLLAIAGYMQLAVLIGAGVLNSAYLATLIYAFVRTGEGAVALLLRAPMLQQLGSVRRARLLLQQRISRTLRVIAMAVWIMMSLDFFGLWTPLDQAIRAALTARLEVGNLALSLGDVLLFVATVWGAFLLSRMLRFLLDEEVYPRLNLRRGVPYAISALVHYGILLFGFLIAVFAAGVDLNRFALLTGAFGVGIGFGLQNVVNNFVSGVILLFERPIQVGDTIQLGELLGDVRRIGI